MDHNKPNEKMNFRINYYWPVLIFCLFFGVALSSAKAEVELPEGEYYLDIIDMQVKVLGGYLTVQRTWYQGKWHFNRAWNDPELEIDTFDGSIESITRNGDLYAVNLLSAGQFFFDDRKIFVPGPNGGYRWQDRRGNYIDYDFNARILSYGDRNEIGVRFRYDTQGRRTGVLDHLGNQILWYEYDLGDDRITAVRDATLPTPRRVQYIYQGDSLHQVIDAADNTWTYEYNADGTLLTRVMDPDARPLNINYYDTRRVKSVTRSDGTGPRYSYDYDETAKEFYVRTTLRSGKVEEQWFDSDGEVIRRDLNETTVYTMYKEGSSRISEDDVGNVTVRKYDQFDNLIRVFLPDRSTKSYKVDPTYSVTLQEIDERGLITKYEYDSRGNLQKQIEAMGRPEERVTEYDYDVYGNLWKKRTLADAETMLAETVYTYDDYGNIDTVTDPEGNVTDYLLYDTMGNPLQWLDERGKLWQRSYDGMGRLLSETDPLDHITAYQYDGAGNRTHEIDSETNPTETIYDENNRQAFVIDPLGNIKTLTYNSFGQQSSEIDEEGRKITYKYDLLDRLIEETDGAGFTTKYFYGGIGTGASYTQLSKVEYPTRSVLYEYDSRGRRVKSTQTTLDTADVVSENHFDLAGNVVLSIDPEQQGTRYVYDALNRLVELVNPLNNSISYQYDNRDNLIQLKNEQDIPIRTMGYDRNNRKKLEILPTGEQWQFDYDAAGNLIWKQDAKGQVERRQYDDANRNYRVQYFVDNLATIPDKTVTFSHDNLGNVISYDDGTISGTIDYDELVRKSSESIDFGPFSKTVSYEFYKNSKIKTFTDWDLRVTEYAYDQGNRLNKIKLPDDLGSIVFTEFKWTNPTVTLLPGGTRQQRSYDDLMRVTAIGLTDPGGNTILNYGYEYDQVGNIEKKLTEHGTYIYDYDDLYRLIDVSSPVLPDKAFSYDPAGNLIQASDVTGLWEYEDSNELLSAGTTEYDYDDNGSTIRQTDNDGVTEYHYDLENRLVSVSNALSGDEVASYYYDPFGRRIWKEVNDDRVYFMHSDEGLVAEFDSSGQEIRGYSYLPETDWGTAPVSIRENADVGFFLLDHLGTPQVIVGSNGKILWQARYTAFGKAEVSKADIDNKLRLPGQYYDAETGLHHNYFRDYDPGIGRYIQSDPIGTRGGINTYLYGLGNPIKNIDPYGLRTCGSGWNEPLVPDNPFGFEFSPCCEAHDNCYGKCGVTKKGCDADFLTCMSNACRKEKLPSRRDICKTWAFRYFLAVNLLGTGAFQNAQIGCPTCP